MLDMLLCLKWTPYVPYDLSKPYKDVSYNAMKLNIAHLYKVSNKPQQKTFWSHIEVLNIAHLYKVSNKPQQKTFWSHIEVWTSTVAMKPKIKVM